MSSLDEMRPAPETSTGRASAGNAAWGAKETPVNEIVKTAQEVKDGEERASPAENRAAWIAAGVGVGIGSAALVAALLYANRDKPKGSKRS
ncbi:MAG TPA: hypothetical protein VE567_06805 [Sphingomonas sp.]|nr:hypothetical protein [Sphingomonas sp.]